MIWFRIGDEAGDEEPDDGTDSLFFLTALSFGLGEYINPDFFPVGVSGVVRGVGNPDDMISFISEN